MRTDRELADEFGISVEKLHDLRRRHHWPCVKLGRYAIRFTEEQVAQIVSQHSETPTKRQATTTAVTGQTARSATRRRSA